MNTPTIFISCGQRTDVERQLGMEISKLVDATGTFTSFFADQQRNLNGLNDNIMEALSCAVGFIAVMHPRGTVVAADSGVPLLTRASVWVEQEIAIAAFINRSRKGNQKIYTAVYSHTSVEREGMRELLHVNAIGFETSEEVIGSLAVLLNSWILHESIDEQGQLLLETNPGYNSSIGGIMTIVPTFHNSGPRANEYSCTVDVPDLLFFDSAYNVRSVTPSKPGYRSFRITEIQRFKEPILNDSFTAFMWIETSIAHLPPLERAKVVGMSIHVSAQVGDRHYRTIVPVAEIFPSEKMQPS